MSGQAKRGRRRYLAATVITAGLAAIAVPAITAAQTAYTSVEVRGNERIETGTVLTYAGLDTGRPLSTGEVNAAYQRIVELGLFQSVDLQSQGSRLVISVQEFPTINQISIEGNKRIDDERLTELLTSQPRRVYSPSTAEADAAAIAEAYTQAGRLAATVTPKIIARSQNRVDLVFEVTEGKVIEVERIGFVGNRSYSDRRLRQVLETKQAGIFRALVKSDTFIEDRIQFDRNVLTDFYRSRGFIDFQIQSVTPQFARERNAFFLTFNIVEGQRFTFGSVSVRSEIPGVSGPQYADALRLRSGQTYSPVRLEDSIARMERLAIQQGVDFLTATPEIVRNNQNQTLDVTFVLRRGPRVFVERIDIEGNSTTLDQVIRRQFQIVEGDPFNPREIRQSAERIRALGYFADAQVTAREGTAPDRVIVDVDVEEQPTGSLSFGINYSVNDGVGLALGLRENNFLGRGQQLNFSLGIGVDNADSVLSLTDPALLGRDLTGSASIYYRTTNQFSADFDTAQAGFRPSISFPVSENGRFGLNYTIEQNEISDVSDDSSIIIQNEEGTLLTSAVGYTYTYDTRRRGLDPNSGVRLEFGQEFAGLGGDTEYIRTTASARGETKVYNEEVGLSVELTGAALNSQDSGSTVTERYRGGGRVRGFDRNGLGPRDLTAENEDALGGNYATSLSFEADFPLGLPEEYGIRGGVFYDLGSIWGLDDTQGTSGEVDDDFHLRQVIGASIFWTTPIGPLRFDFTRALEKESYDEVQNFNFSISTRF